MLRLMSEREETLWLLSFRCNGPGEKEDPKRSSGMYREPKWERASTSLLVAHTCPFFS